MEQELNIPQQVQESSSCNTHINSVPPNNHLVLAIFTTVCCCLPLGIYAIILANNVNTYFIAGQPELAEKYAADAKTWSIIGIVVGLVFNIIYSAIYFALEGY